MFHKLFFLQFARTLQSERDTAQCFIEEADYFWKKLYIRQTIINVCNVPLTCSVELLGIKIFFADLKKKIPSQIAT